MTKEEKIKDVYQKLGFIWSKMQHLVTENGVLILPTPDLKYYLEGYENLVSDKEKFLSFGKEGLKLQPSSLSGIYNNNGWTKIESEIDLPKESGWYEFQIFPQEKYVPNHSYWNVGNVKVGWFIETYTHYRLIQSTKNPIY